MGLTQLLLTGIIMVINQKFFISGFKSLWHRAPNMDTLVALGATAAFVLQHLCPFRHDRRAGPGRRWTRVMTYMMDFYFESAAMILTLITVGKMLEARSKGKTTDALKGLMKPGPQNRHRAAGRQGGGLSPWSRCSRATCSRFGPGRASPWTAWCWRAPAR